MVYEIWCILRSSLIARNRGLKDRTGYPGFALKYVRCATHAPLCFSQLLRSVFRTHLLRYRKNTCILTPFGSVSMNVHFPSVDVSYLGLQPSVLSDRCDPIRVMMVLRAGAIRHNVLLASVVAQEPSATGTRLTLLVIERK